MTEEFEVPVPLGESDVWSQSAKRLLGLYDVPAYVRRGLQVTDAISRFTKRCQQQREELLDGVRMRLRAWNAAAKRSPATADKWYQPNQAMILHLNEMLLTEVDRPAGWATPPRAAAAWRDLVSSIARFNDRWRKFAATVDAAAVNRLIDGYNRYYLFEKECVIRSPALASRNFQPLAPITPDWILEQFPLLPTPAND